MKKLLMAALVLALVTSTVGCGTESASSEERPLTEQEIIQQKINANFDIADGDFELVQFEEPEQGDDIAVIETSLGTIKVRLFAGETPSAVKSFESIAAAGRYDGQKFSQIVNNYLIQSSGVSGTEVFENEYTLNLWNFRGAVGMVNSAGGTNGNQFYIIQNNGLTQDVMDQMQSGGFPKAVQEKYNKLGGAPWMDGKYTVFGQVIEGMDVVDMIAVTAAEEKAAAEAAASTSSAASSQASAAASSQAGTASQDENAIVITKVTIEKYGIASSSQAAGSSSAAASGQ